MSSLGNSDHVLGKGKEGIATYWVDLGLPSCSIQRLQSLLPSDRWIEHAWTAHIGSIASSHTHLDELFVKKQT